MRVPWGGASCLGVGRPGSGALPSPTTHPFGRAAGAHYPLAVGAGSAGVGTRHQLHSALLRAGFARYGGGTRAPGGGRLLPGCGASGSGALPAPTTRPFWRAAGAHYPLAVGAGVRAWGPVTHSTAHALSSWLCALWGQHEGARGGGPLAWASVDRALSHPRPPVFWSVRPGPTTHWLWVQGVRVWGPVTNPTARALASWLCALWGRHEGAPGGGASCLGVGRLGSGALPTPTARPLGRAAGAHYPLAAGAGGAGVGSRHQPHRARSCELALRVVGAA